MARTTYSVPVPLVRAYRIALNDYEKTLRRWYGRNYAGKLSVEEADKLDRLRKAVSDRRKFIKNYYADRSAA